MESPTWSSLSGLLGNGFKVNFGFPVFHAVDFNIYFPNL